MIKSLDYNGIGKKIIIEFEKDLISRCPVDNAIDRTIIIIKYIPGRRIIEYYSLKKFINSFIDKQISYEDIVNVFFDRIMQVIKPNYLMIKLIDVVDLKITIIREN